LVTFYTREYGKIRGIVKGIKADPKCYGSRLDIFTCNDIVFYQKPQQDLSLVSQASLTEHFSDLGRDVERFGSAGYVVDLIDAVTVDHDPDEAAYELLLGTLRVLEQHPDPKWITHHFEVKLLQRIGLTPVLDICNNCRSSIVERTVFFKMEERGVLCERCGGGLAEGLLLHRDTLELLGQLQQAEELPMTLSTLVSEQTRNELAALLRRVVDYHVGRRLRSVDFAQKVRSWSAQAPSCIV